eukprot:360642-Chlamydomonas_euryale.AAC.5
MTVTTAVAAATRSGVRRVGRLRLPRPGFSALGRVARLWVHEQVPGVSGRAGAMASEEAGGRREARQLLRLHRLKRCECCLTSRLWPRLGVACGPVTRPSACMRRSAPGGEEDWMLRHAPFRCEMTGFGRPPTPAAQRPAENVHAARARQARAGDGADKDCGDAAAQTLCCLPPFCAQVVGLEGHVNEADAAAESNAHVARSRKTWVSVAGLIYAMRMRLIEFGERLPGFRLARLGKLRNLSKLTSRLISAILLQAAPHQKDCLHYKNVAARHA